MKKLFLVLVALVVGLSANETLKVGATPVPAAVMLEFAKPMLKAKGIDLVVQNFTDYITPNVSLAKGSSDANLYQHVPFLENTNKKQGFELVPVAHIYIVPLGFYSDKYKSLDEFPVGATIALPNDPTNYSRALLILDKHGYIKLKDPNNIASTEFDIVENPKKFVFKQVEAATLPKIYKGVDGAVITGNYALQAKLGINNSLFHEDASSPYTNVLATRKELANDPRVLALRDALQSKEMADFLNEKYNGEIFLVNKK